MVATLAERQSPTATVRYWPRGASAELFRRREPEIVVSGPAGTGKTYGWLWRLHLLALKYPGMRGIIIRKTLESLTASALVTYQNRVLGAGRFGVKPFGGSKLKPAGFHYANGSELLIGGMDKPDKVMSQEYDIVYVNEVPELSQEDWENLTTRARYGVMPYQQVGGDCNPHGPGHWLYKRIQSGKTAMLFSVHEDNPALFDPATQAWTEAGRAYLAKLGNLSGFRRDRLLLGKWTAAEGAVYPAFSRQEHVRAVDCAGWSTLLALDMGTRNPTAILTIRHAGDRVHVEREIYERGWSSDSITDAAAKAFAGSGATHLVIDPSAAGLIASLAERNIPVRKGDNDIKTGISRLTSLLPDLTVDPSCVNLIDEFESYRYPSGGRSESNDTPVKEFDHALDALRYAAMDLAAPEPAIDIW